MAAAGAPAHSHQAGTPPPAASLRRDQRSAAAGRDPGQRQPPPPRRDPAARLSRTTPQRPRHRQRAPGRAGRSFPRPRPNRAAARQAATPAAREALTAHQPQKAHPHRKALRPAMTGLPQPRLRHGTARHGTAQHAPTATEPPSFCRGASGVTCAIPAPIKPLSNLYSIVSSGYPAPENGNTRAGRAVGSMTIMRFRWH